MTDVDFTAEASLLAVHDHAAQRARFARALRWRRTASVLARILVGGGAMLALAWLLREAEPPPGHVEGQRPRHDAALLAPPPSTVVRATGDVDVPAPAALVLAPPAAVLATPNRQRDVGPRETSALRQQLDLFVQAEDAASRDPAAALGLIDRLIQSYPQSALALDAGLLKVRVLRDMGRRPAAAEALAEIQDRAAASGKARAWESLRGTLSLDGRASAETHTP